MMYVKQRGRPQPVIQIRAGSSSLAIVIVDGYELFFSSFSFSFAH